MIHLEDKMKDISELNFDETVKYAAEHTWARPDGEQAVVGISDYAQDQLGEIVFVELPEIGAHFDQGQQFGLVESIKTASDLYMPLSGEVVAVNTNLDENPEVINDSPYGEGWMVKIQPSDPAQWDGLMAAGPYRDQLD